MPVDASVSNKDLPNIEIILNRRAYDYLVAKIRGMKLNNKRKKALSYQFSVSKR